MTPDPTMPPEPVAQPASSTDPWAAAPPPPTYAEPPAHRPAPPATAEFPTPPAAGQPSAPPATTEFPATPYSAPPATAQYSAPPYSAPPGAPYSAPPGAPYSAPPGTAVVRPGPHPPVMAPVPALPGGYPPPQGAVAVQIGEILVSPPVIRTPAGVLPLAGASWHVTDYWQKEEKTAQWAIVCAIVGFFCLTIFSLLFLLIKETRHHGTVQVSVMNGAQQYVARIPVADQAQVQHINNQVNYARSLSTM
ncbi:hypothetical protein GA0070606_4503 [Micromonospora citrea]|uniref:Uncharacterized protein n=1 Tax=Micromonospora citrea TaxID=47855 RepID=A0A1C6VLK2_9ACTN|nr:hypothetical protein GA0070606_4503 [Micromonospora citrea]